jgi:hypothetical protein
MTHRRWPFAVHDARGSAHRGAVTYTDSLDEPLSAPELPLRFHIVLLALPGRTNAVPERTAVCVPGTPKLKPVRAKVPPPSLPKKIVDLWLPPRLMAAYAAGRIAGPPRRVIAVDEVFPPHSDRPRLDRLALAIVAASEAELIAPWAAVIRHELKLRPGADALGQLDARLEPADASLRPPSRSPAVRRLRNASKRLHAGLAPQITLEQATEDLRVLLLFDNEPISRAGLDRLLSDVRQAPGRKHAKRPAKPATVVPLHGKRGSA